MPTAWHVLTQRRRSLACPQVACNRGGRPHPTSKFRKSKKRIITHSHSDKRHANTYVYIFKNIITININRILDININTNVNTNRNTCRYKHKHKSKRQSKRKHKYKYKYKYIYIHVNTNISYIYIHPFKKQVKEVQKRCGAFHDPFLRQTTEASRNIGVTFFQIPRSGENVTTLWGSIYVYVSYIHKIITHILFIKYSYDIHAIFI